MTFQIFGLILALVIAAGIITAIMVWQKKKDYRAFYKMGLIVIALSIALIIISFILQIIFVIGIPILIVGLIYLMTGQINKAKWESNV